MKHFSLFVLLLCALAMPVAAQQSRSVPQDDQSDRPKIDVESYAVEATIEPQDRKLSGKADIRFKQLDRKNYAVFDIDRRLRV